MKTSKISKALLEVWDWKESAYKEVKNFDRETALRKRLETSLQTAHRLGFEPTKLNRKFSSVLQ